MNGSIFWRGRPVPFLAGESVGLALQRAGIGCLGVSATGGAHGLFCGIGQCQNCLIVCEGRTVEACLTRCRDGLDVAPVGGTDV